jgi:hypothetical protein
MPLVNKKEENEHHVVINRIVPKKCSQMLMYFVTTDSTFVNMNMRTIIGSDNFELGATYNLIMRAQMSDISPIADAQTANHFIFNCNAMRFKNYETAVGKLNSNSQFVTYASFPMFSGGVGCNVTNMKNSCVYSFVLEAEVGNMTLQMQSQVNNAYDTNTIYSNYLLIFDIYKCI